MKYLNEAKTLAMRAREISDEELRALYEELDERRPRSIKDKCETYGEGVLYHDLIMILGAERGLWNEAGYAKEPTERKFDDAFSRACEEKICELWYDFEYPLLVFFILDLKFGIRRIDERALRKIDYMVSGAWCFPGENEILRWRLKTLQYAVWAVMLDRGYYDGLKLY